MSSFSSRLVQAVLVYTALGAGLALAAEQTAIQWRFDRAGDLGGWSIGGHIEGGGVRGGAFAGKVSGSDPILFSPVFEIAATPTQVIEIAMKTSADGQAELFWTHTLEGQFGGFSQERSERFTCRGDGQPHVYRIYPFWHPVRKIVRLRLDPPNSGEFAIAAIRIIDEGSPAPSTAKTWEFRSSTAGWRAWQQTSEPTVSDGAMATRTEGASPLLMSPLLAVPAEENAYITIRMAVDRGETGRVMCVSSTKTGTADTGFDLRADGRMHTYTIDALQLPNWRDTIMLLGLQPTDAAGASVRVESIDISDRPTGPPEMKLTYFGQADGVNRVGRPAGLACGVLNVGGRAAENVVARLSVPAGIKIIGGAERKFHRLGRDLRQTAQWQIQVDQPRDVEALLELAAPGAETVRARTTFSFTPVPQVDAAGYIPPPQPVECKYDIGVFYFPGWADMTRWQPILGYPERRPVLGWYDESNPECADWQIKWAVEHGVKFFMVDWYWSQGNRHLEHWLHEAYMKARFRKDLQWAIMWANHNAPNTHSLDDWRKVTQYWIDNYFGMKEYYRIDGRPAVFIWAPQNIRRDVGGSPKAAELYALSQKMAREAGHPGIYFVAMSSHQGQTAAAELESEGYEAYTAYHAFELAAQRAGSGRFPYRDVVDTSREVWQRSDSHSDSLLYIPLVDTGWSSEPWHRSQARVIYGRTPELFGQLCRNARQYADQTGKRIIAIGPWNEWGEGSYIEPYAEHGFGHLEQLRSAFCDGNSWPPALVPQDVGRGPYDLPPIEERTAWEFNQPGDLEGWSASGGLSVKVEGGMMIGRSSGSDPILQAAIQLEAERFRTLVIRMKSDTADRSQVFWGTSLSGPSEATSLRFDVVGDSQFHEYKLDLAGQRTWRGIITSLRFDPTNKSGVEMAVDYIRLE